MRCPVRSAVGAGGCSHTQLGAAWDDWLGGVPLPAALSYDAPLDAYLARHPDRLLNPSPAAGDEDGDDCGAMRSMVCMRGAQKIVLGRGGCIG